MSRLIGCLALALLTAGPVVAGELDREFGGKAPAPPAIVADALPTTSPPSSPAEARPAGELDAETPTQACGWRRGFGLGFGRFGYGGLGGFGFPYGGFGGFGMGYSSFSLGYGGFGGFGFPYGGFGYGGFGGLGMGYGLGGFGGYGLGGFGGFGGFGGWGCW